METFVRILEVTLDVIDVAGPVIRRIAIPLLKGEDAIRRKRVGDILDEDLAMTRKRLEHEQALASE